MERSEVKCDTMFEVLAYVDSTLMLNKSWLELVDRPLPWARSTWRLWRWCGGTFPSPWTARVKYHQQHVACAAGSLSRELRTLFGARRGLGASRRLQLFKLNRFPLSPLHSQPRQTQKEKMNIFQGKWRYWTAWLCPPEPGGDWRALIFPLKGSHSGRGLSFSAEIIMINIIMKRKKN